MKGHPYSILITQFVVIINILNECRIGFSVKIIVSEGHRIVTSEIQCNLIIIIIDIYIAFKKGVPLNIIICVFPFLEGIASRKGTTYDMFILLL